MQQAVKQEEEEEEETPGHKKDQNTSAASEKERVRGLRKMRETNKPVKGSVTQ